MMRDWNYSL